MGAVKKENSERDNLAEGGGGYTLSQLFNKREKRRGNKDDHDLGFYQRGEGKLLSVGNSNLIFDGRRVSER